MLAALVALAVAVTSLVVPAGSATASRTYLLTTSDELASLPTSGAAWTSLVDRANQPLVPDLGDQNNKSPAYAVAAALVYARTGDDAYRAKVANALAGLPGTEHNAGARTLSVGRQLAGWVLAADLIGYRDASFVSWVSSIRTATIGGHSRWTTLRQTHETTSSNWGAFAGASRIAASLYLGDTADVAEAAKVFRGWLGDGAAWPTLAVGQSGTGFAPTADFDPSWACAYPGWQPTNGGCGDRTGALVEDISRGDAYPNATEIGLSYSWESLQGATLQAILLGRNGYPDVWTWQDRALGRAVDFLATHGGLEGTNFNGINHWVTQATDQVYGTSYSRHAAGNGRNFGYTDWLRVTPSGSAAPSDPSDPSTGSPTDPAAPVVRPEPLPLCDGRAGAPFGDVPAGTAHAATVACAAYLGIVNGTAPSTFAPALPVTRAQLAAIAYRLLDRSGRAPAGTVPDAFGDDDTSIHEPAINALASLGIVGGTADGGYSPTQPVTRAQMVSVLVRALDRGWKTSLPTGADAFDDDTGSVHEAATNAAAAAGIVAGVGHRRFAGDADVRRDQAATLLVRLAHRVL